MAKRFGKSLSQKVYHSAKQYFDTVNRALNQYSESAVGFGHGDDNEDISADKDPKSTEESTDPAVSLR